MNMNMALGPFRIGLDTQALEELEDSEGVRIAKMGRAGQMTHKQFLEPDDREIIFQTVVYPLVLSSWGLPQIEVMRLVMRTGRRLPLISRSGHPYGVYFLEHIKSNKSHVLPNGQFQKIKATITLTRAPLGFKVFGIPLF